MAQSVRLLILVERIKIRASKKATRTARTQIGEKSGQKASDRAFSGEFIRVAMKKKKHVAPAKRKSSRTTAPLRNGNGARGGSRSPSSYRHPKSEFEVAIQRYVDLYDFAPIGYVTFDRAGRIEELNLAAIDLLGSGHDRLIGKPLALHVVKEDSDLFSRHLLRCRSTEGPVETEVRLKRRNGEPILVNLRSVPTASSMRNGTILYQTAIIDLTERNRAEGALREAHKLLEARIAERTAELRAANKELENEIKRRRGLEGEILEISDREQQRLGEELHDGICQHLTAVAFMARSVALRLKNHRVVEVDDLEKIAELVNAAAADTRNVSRALHRIDIDSAGLVGALQDLVDRAIWKTPCRLKINRAFQIDDDTVASHLYRIAREAVINASKHAQAREIVVELGRSHNGTFLSVTDDGVGFQNKSNRRQGLGFHIMSYRARAAGGHLEVESPRRGGTRIICYLPEAK